MSAQSPTDPAAPGEVVLDVKGLRTYFYTRAGVIKAVTGVDFHVNKGEVLGLVGESGCGKSVTSLSILGLVGEPGKVEAGEAVFGGKNLLELPDDEMRKIRGDRIAMIFQQPQSSLNPVMKVGPQIAESLQIHRGMDEKAARARSLELMDMVGIPDAKRRYEAYPHEMSGGMAQRVMIAIGLACEPELLIADEPTTALDVTIQAQILELMLRVREQTGDASILLITHDLAVVAETCQRVAVMYGGKIQEIADVEALFGEPLHPYTRGLLKSLPRPDRERKERLDTIEGIVPSVFDFPRGCKYWTRCPEKIDRCEQEEPELVEVAPGRQCRCHLVEAEPLKAADAEAPA